MRPKMKLFTVKFRRIFEVFALRGLWRKFWAHYHDFCVHKQSCLLWSSGTFWKFSACNVYRKSYGRIFTIYTSKNEAVSCEVQTHFGRFHFVRFIKKFLAYYHDPTCKVYSKSSGRNFTIFAPKNEAVFLGVQTHFGSSLPANFAEKVLGAYSRFLRPNMKLFAVKFRRNVEVFVCEVYKKFWALLQDICVQKRSCLPWCSDAFWKFSAIKCYKKICGRNITIYASKN